MLPCEKAVLQGKPEMIETKKIHDDTSAVQSLFSSEPCLKFVTKKTHTSTVPVKEAANNEIVCTITANILQEKNLHETSMGSRGNKKTSIKKKKEFNIPCRSSKRLAGLGPELVVNSSSSEQPLEPTTTIDSCYKGVTQDVGLASENLADGACKPLDAGPITGHRCDSSNTTSVSCSNKSKEPLQDQIFLADKCQMLVTEKMLNEKSNLQFSFPFTYSWSDPCLEFARKTLTGAIPLEDAVNNELVSAPAVNIMQENNIGKTVMQSDSTEKTVLNSSKSKKRKNNKELNLPR
ncbi:hypothetical protein SLEP1_g8677 [Rubroshorea leprosula]|uniref:Uncharacterized protein n=1 Tax=Rubroshorea leprosula TaxID=152421 RepID=A0AAV5I2F8_9ROSI|nr:hypothetical protein SLEP1_g8677 [Rubroshorea leprosula]